MTADPTPRLAEIKARLEGATPGPWADDGWDCYHEGQEWQRCVMSGDGQTIIADCPSELFGNPNDIPDNNPARCNATFIAGAPSDMAYLLDVAERAEALMQSLYGLPSNCGKEDVIDAALAREDPGDLYPESRALYDALTSLAEALGWTP